MNAVAQAELSIGRQAWNFARHFLEMCIAMCVVGTPLVVALFAWQPELRDQLLAFSVVLVGIIYTAPMVAWMAYRGMGRRPILEMGCTTIGLALVLVVLNTFGVLSDPGLQAFAGPGFCGPACVLMFAVMLPRLGMYTGRTGHTMGHGPGMGHTA